MATTSLDLLSTASTAVRPAAGSFESAAWVAALLSGVAGYVDSAGFLALFGLFTAHVTGELVAIGTAIAERPTFAMLGRLAIIPTFMLSVAATALFMRMQKRRGTGALASLLGLMTAALTLFCATGVILQPLASSPDVWAVGLTAGTGIMAMAIQNTLMRDVLSSSCPTTLMTGNLTQVSLELVELLLPSTHGDRRTRALVRSQSKARLKRFGLPLVAFMLGAALGALLTRALGLVSIAVPTVAVGALTIVVGRASRRPREARSIERAPADSLMFNHQDPIQADAISVDDDALQASRDLRVSTTRLIAVQGHTDTPPPIRETASVSGEERARTAS